MEKNIFGLQNIGNTCYANTALQLLTHSTCLNNIMNNKKEMKKKKEFPIVIY